jgi:MFS family permease
MRMLRRGSMLVLVGVALATVAAVAFDLYLHLGGPVVPRGPLHRGPRPASIEGVLGALLTAMAAAVVAAVIGFVGFAYMMSSSRILSRIDYRYERGVTASRLISIGLAGIIVGALLIIAGALAGNGGAALAGFVIAGLSALLGFIGTILFALYIESIADLRVDGFHAPEGFRTAGTLLLVGVALSIIPFVSVIGFLLQLAGTLIVYTSSGEALEGLSRMLRYTPAPLY